MTKPLQTEQKKRFFQKAHATLTHQNRTKTRKQKEPGRRRPFSSPGSHVGPTPADKANYRTSVQTAQLAGTASPCRSLSASALPILRRTPQHVRQRRRIRLRPAHHPKNSNLRVRQPLVPRPHEFSPTPLPTDRRVHHLAPQPGQGQTLARHQATPLRGHRARLPRREGPPAQRPIVQPTRRPAPPAHHQRRPRRAALRLRPLQLQQSPMKIRHGHYSTTPTRSIQPIRHSPPRFPPQSPPP